MKIPSHLDMISSEPLKIEEEIGEYLRSTDRYFIIVTDKTYDVLSTMMTFNLLMETEETHGKDHAEDLRKTIKEKILKEHAISIDKYGKKSDPEHPLYFMLEEAWGEINGRYFDCTLKDRKNPEKEFFYPIRLTEKTLARFPDGPSLAYVVSRMIALHFVVNFMPNEKALECTFSETNLEAEKKQDSKFINFFLPEKDDLNKLLDIAQKHIDNEEVKFNNKTD